VHHLGSLPQKQHPDGNFYNDLPNELCLHRPPDNLRGCIEFFSSSI
jgi:hypothetical protein